MRDALVSDLRTPCDVESRERRCRVQLRDAGIRDFGALGQVQGGERSQRRNVHDACVSDPRAPIHVERS